MNKYRNKKVFYDGILFASGGEANRYAELKILEKIGRIENFEIQKKFVLQPGFNCNGKNILPICYFADFVYYDNDLKKTVIEDFKGYETDEFKIKWKMLKFKYSDKFIYIKSGRK